MQTALAAAVSALRARYVNAYNGGSSQVASRALVVRALADDGAFKQAEYNPAFVLMEYFGYLRRNPDEHGYQFWLNTLNGGGGQNYHGMVCAFVTSREYQQRFSSVVSRSDVECGR